MKEDGFSLVESVCAMAILALAFLGMAPAFQTMMDANTIAEERSGAVIAAQQRLESLRRQSPASMPTSGTSMTVVDTGDREYEVVVTYCDDGSFCATNMRHIVLEINFGGERVYDLETVYTRVQ